MGIAGPGTVRDPPSQHRLSELSARGKSGIEPESRLPAPAGSAGKCFTSQQPCDVGDTVARGEIAGGDGTFAMPPDGAT
jgi:hypothetical protein